MSSVWAFIKMLVEVWEALKVLLGLVKKAEHDGNIKEIGDDADAAGDPEKSLEERLRAGQEIENNQNKHT